MKKKFTLIACTILLLQTSSWGQFDHEWTSASGGAGADYGNALAHDADGNIYTTGRFYATVDFDPGLGNVSLTSAGDADVFITKQDPIGNLIWAKRIGSTSADYGFSIKIDGTGNVFVAGNFSASVDFDPGAGNTSLTSLGTTDAFVLKLNSDGNFQWAKPFTGNNSQFALSLTIDPNSNVLVAGYFALDIDIDPGAGTINRSAVGGMDLFVVKLNISGDYVWGGTVGGSGNEIAYSIVTDANSNVFIAGQFMGTVDFDFGAGSTTLTSSGVEEAFVLKMNSAGVFQWVKNFGGSGVDVGRDVEVDQSGNVYTIGYFSGTADFDPGAGTSTSISAGSGDIFISKLDANGSFVWSKTLGSTGNDYALGIEIDANENLFITGRYYATVDFDPNLGTAAHTSNGDADAYILWLDMSGQFIDVESFGGLGAEIGFSLSLNTSNELFLTGAFDQTVNFDPSGLGTSFTSNGASDCFVTKYSTCPTPMNPTINVGSSSVCNGETEIYSVTVVPGATSYTWTLPSGWAGTSISEAITTSVGTSSGVISVTANNGCGASATSTINVTVNMIPTILGNDITICEGSAAELEASADYGTINWYDESSGGISLANGPIFITDVLYNDTIFYLESDNSGCINTPRYAISVTVNSMPNIGLNPGGGAITSLQNDATSYQWIDCNNSNEEILDETSQMYIPTLNGSYAVVVNLNGCVDTSACEIVSNVGLEEFVVSPIKLYPNPSSNNFTVEMIKEISSISVYSFSGEFVQSNSYSGTTTIELAPNVKAGVYLIKVIDSENTQHILQWIKL